MSKKTPRPPHEKKAIGCAKGLAAMALVAVAGSACGSKSAADDARPTRQKCSEVRAWEVTERKRLAELVARTKAQDEADAMAGKELVRSQRFMELQSELEGFENRRTLARQRCDPKA